MSTFVPIEAKGGIMLLPDQGRSLQAQDHYQLVTTRRSPAPLSLVPKLRQIEVLPMPLSLRKYTRHFSAIDFLRLNKTNPSNPPLGQELEVKMYVGADASAPRYGQTAL
jgi:hypothetical protein